jgi:hypothetical protein
MDTIVNVSIFDLYYSIIIYIISNFITVKMCPGDSLCNSNGVCNEITGECTCHNGFYGPECNRKYSCLFVFTRLGGMHDRCFQPVTRFLPSLGQNPPRGPIKPRVTPLAYVF